MQERYEHLQVATFQRCCLIFTEENIQSNFNGSNMLGPWKFVLDMGTCISSHRTFIIAPEQTVRDNLGMSFSSSIK